MAVHEGGNLVHVQINIRNLVRLDMGQVPQIGKQVLQTFFICLHLCVTSVILITLLYLLYSIEY